MIEGTCLCGAVRWRFNGTPAGASACNCTACRRYGVLWAYGYERAHVAVSGETRAYVRGDAIEFHFCPVCGNLAYWRAQREDGLGRRLGVNLRLAPPEAVADIPVEHLDGLADADDPLPDDGRRVRDYWA